MNKSILLRMIGLLLLILPVTAFADADVKRGGIVKVTASKQGVLIKNFNPFSPKALHSTFGCFYEPLVFANDYTGEVTPWLAQKVTWSDDLKVLTFDLHQNVKWNDGTPFTADDVIFTLMLGKDNKALDRAGLWSQGLVAVKKINQYQVVFEFESVNTTILPKIGGTYIVPQHIWKNIEAPETWTENENPVATGPFILNEGSFTGQSFLLKRNEAYWQSGKDGKPLPYIEGIQYISATGNEQGAMKVISGQVDWGGYFIANIDQTYVQRDPENNHYWLAEGNIVYLNFNNAKAPFSNVKIRKAVAMAINPEEITTIMNSGAVPADQSGVKQGYADWLSEAAKQYQLNYDPEGAIQLLESEGYQRNSDGIMEKEGKPLSFNLYVPTGWTDWVTAVDTIGTQLAEVGIETRITQVAWPSPFLTNIQKGEYDISIDYVNSGFSPYFQYNNILPSRHWAPLGEDATGHSQVRYKNETVDQAFNEYSQTNNAQKQLELMDTILTAVMRDTPLVPLFFNPIWFEYSTRNFVGWPHANNAYTAPKTSRMAKMPVFLNIHLK